MPNKWGLSTVDLTCGSALLISGHCYAHFAPSHARTYIGSNFSIQPFLILSLVIWHVDWPNMWLIFPNKWDLSTVDLTWRPALHLLTLQAGTGVHILHRLTLGQTSVQISPFNFFSFSLSFWSRTAFLPWPLNFSPFRLMDWSRTSDSQIHIWEETISSRRVRKF